MIDFEQVNICWINIEKINTVGHKIWYTIRFFVVILPIFDQCSFYVETRLFVFTSKMFEKHMSKSDILSKDAGHRQIC